MNSAGAVEGLESRGQLHILQTSVPLCTPQIGGSRQLRKMLRRFFGVGHLIGSRELSMVLR